MNARDIVVVDASRCKKCGSSRRTKYANPDRRDYSGAGLDFVAIIYRTCRCLDCGQARRDQEMVYAPRVSASDDSEKLVENPMAATFDDIYLVSKKLVLSRHDEVAAAEQAIWSSFPPGYTEFVTQLGDGELTTWVRINPPARIQASFQVFQERLKEYFFWESGRDVLPQERVVECIPLGSTMNGDELIFHPSDVRRILALPRNDEAILEIGSSLPEAIEWLFRSGVLTKSMELKAFRPNRSLWRFGFHTQDKTPTLREVRDLLLGLKLHDRVIDTIDDPDDPLFTMFVQEFGGCVSMLGDLDITRVPGRLSVYTANAGERDFLVDGVPASHIGLRPLITVEMDEERLTPKVQSIIKALGQLGYEASPPVSS